MVFNSVVFLFCFLPLALLAYYLVPGRGKNVVLLVESLLFYCWTGVEYLPADCLPDRIQLPVGAADSAHQSQTERPAACRGGAGQPGGAGLL